MLSEPVRSEPRGDGGRWEWLFSQGLGVVCGQLTVALLAVGSVVLAATRDGASAGIGMDDLRAFFAPPSAVHLWLYLLFPVLSLYALNTALATWRNVARRWRNGLRAPRFYGPAVIHVAFLAGLLAHAVGGLSGGEPSAVLVGPSWSDLGDGRQARVTALDVDSHADGSTKQVRVGVELRAADGSLETAVVDYNGPLTRSLGSELWLLMRAQAVPAVRLARGSAACEVAVEGACDLDGVRAELLHLLPPTRAGGEPVARLRVVGDDGPRETFWLARGRPQRLADGSQISVAGIELRPAALLQHRHAPGNPWALLASVLLALGLAMMWRRFGPSA